MASDDFEVVAFKPLSYLYRCMKGGKKVDIAALRQLVGCSETYFGAVARSLQSKGLVEGFDFDAFSGIVIDSPNIAAMSDPMITMDGAIFVSENSRMRKAKDFAGHAGSSPHMRGTHNWLQQQDAPLSGALKRLIRQEMQKNIRKS